MVDRIIRVRGHTLIELLVVFAIVAILAGAAVPAFHHLLLDSRRNAAITTAMHVVQLGRQLAAVRGRPIHLCGSSDASECSGDGDWSSGFLLTDDGTGLRRKLPLDSARRALHIRSNRATVDFEGGTGFASPATLTICDRRGGTAARAVIISRSGRPRISERDASERPLRC